MVNRSLLLFVPRCRRFCSIHAQTAFLETEGGCGTPIKSSRREAANPWATFTTRSPVGRSTETEL
eukprot:GSA120T00007920001.1